MLHLGKKKKKNYKNNSKTGTYSTSTGSRWQFLLNPVLKQKSQFTFHFNYKVMKNVTHHS